MEFDCRKNEPNIDTKLKPCQDSNGWSFNKSGPERFFVKMLLLPFCFNDIGHFSGVTEKRIDLALQISWGAMERYCVFSTGYGRDKPTEPRANREVSLAAQMDQYIWNHRPSTNVCVYNEPLGWGTLSEMVWAIRLARKKFKFGDEAVVIVVSSKDHLPRIRKYAWWIMPRGWWVQYHAIDHKLHEPIEEQAKFLKDLPWLLWLWLKIIFGYPL